MRYQRTLTHRAVRRLVEGKASVLILDSEWKIGRYDIADAAILRRNRRLRECGRFEEQEDETVLSIELRSHHRCPLLELDFKTIHRAGFRTSEDFYVDWREGRRRVDDDAQVNVYGFVAVAQERFLHTRVHRGYTSDPSLAARGEPEALSTDDLERVTRRWQQPTETATARAQRSIALRAKGAALRGDAAGLTILAAELAGIVAAGTVFA